MAFPVVADFATAEANNASPHNLEFPPHNAGDIIVLFYVCRTASNDAPGDLDGVPWTLLGSGGYSNAVRVWWLRAETDSPYTASRAVTPTEPEAFVSVGVRITGADPNTDLAFAAVDSSTDPPALDPAAWGVEDTLWLACWGDHTNEATGAPTNYSTVTNFKSVDEANAYDSLFITERSIATSSQDPSEFTGAQYTGYGLASTIAVRAVPPNDPPVADAGPDQTVAVDSTVQLDGSGSTDPNGDPLSYSWTVVDDGGTGLATSDLNGASTATASFTAPPPAEQTETFTASGTWTAPTSISSVTAQAWGGGAGAGEAGAESDASGGGGGGAYASGTTAVNEGTDYTVTVGAGGAPGLPGETGGDSSFASDVTAKGGSGGSFGGGGAGGSAADSLGESAFSGGAGGVAASDQSVGGGGGGSAFTNAAGGDGASGDAGGAGGDGTGDGGDGANVSHGGLDGFVPGGGGGGQGSSYRSGGSGNSGQVTLSYTPNSVDIVLQLQVTDSAGASDTDTVTVTVEGYTAEFAATLPALTAAFEADLLKGAELAATLPSLQAEYSASAEVDAELAGSLPSLLASAAAEAEVAAELNATLPALAASLEGEAEFQHASFEVTLPPLSGSITLRDPFVYTEETFTPDIQSRFIAQDISSGRFLNWALPLTGVSVTDTLSGANEIVGEFKPEMGHLNLSAYEPWATKVHLEQGGRIRASGILQPYSLTEARAKILVLGPSDYPHGIPFLGSFQGVDVDPLDIVRKLWAEVQSYPDGYLGVTLDDTKSPVRLGDEKELVDLDAISGPYKLVWWQATDCGQEIDKLARNTPFDYREVATWNANKTDVDYHIRLGYPRLGRFRSDLRFAAGENLSDPIPWTEAEEQYASSVVVLGAGEGRRRIRATASERGERLRRVTVISDKSIDSQADARKIALAELRRRKALISFEQITVDTSHPNARWGTFDPGDDIPVTGEFPWLGWKTINHRITASTWSPDSPLVDLRLVPSAAQYYGPPLNGV